MAILSTVPPIKCKLIGGTAFFKFTKHIGHCVKKELPLQM